MSIKLFTIVIMLCLSNTAHAMMLSRAKLLPRQCALLYQQVRSHRSLVGAFQAATNFEKPVGTESYEAKIEGWRQEREDLKKVRRQLTQIERYFVTINDELREQTKDIITEIDEDIKEHQELRKIMVRLHSKPRMEEEK